MNFGSYFNILSSKVYLMPHGNEKKAQPHRLHSLPDPARFVIALAIIRAQLIPCLAQIQDKKSLSHFQKAVTFITEKIEKHHDHLLYLVWRKTIKETTRIIFAGIAQRAWELEQNPTISLQRKQFIFLSQTI